VERERRILDAAATLFSEKGFHGVGMDELGVRAGLSGPALYRHFAGKNDILAALLNEAMDELLPATAPVLDDPVAELSRMIRHHVAFAVDHRSVVDVYLREARSLQEPWRRHVDRRRRHYLQRWRAAVARRYPRSAEEDVAGATQACLGVVLSVAHWPARLTRLPQVVDLVERFATEGLRTLETPSA
jgi:AcrR family transcriptional regulator